MNAIEAKGLTKYFGDKTAVNQLNLNIAEGEIYGFLGENGAGKSTTIRMLLGLIWPDEGEAHINGKRVRSGRNDFLYGLGAMLDNPYIYGHLSVTENLRLFAGLSGKVTDSQIDWALNLLGLEEMKKQAAGTLSHGQKQRLGIAQALLPENRIILLDEPQNGLDPLWVKNLREILTKLASEGITILISSHRLHEIEQICDRVGIIHQGELLYQGEVGPLLAADNLLSIVCDRMEEAKQLLNERGFTLDASNHRQILVNAREESAPAVINRMLVESGFEISELMRKRVTLEEIFLKLTNTPRNSHD